MSTLPSGNATAIPSASSLADAFSSIATVFVPLADDLECPPSLFSAGSVHPCASALCSVFVGMIAGLGVFVILAALLLTVSHLRDKKPRYWQLRQEDPAMEMEMLAGEGEAGVYGQSPSPINEHAMT